MTPRVEHLRAALTRAFPFRADHVERGITLFGAAWLAEFEALLERMFPDDLQLERAAKGYVDFVLDGMRLMKKFERTGVYVAKSYAAASEEVYRNGDYMRDLYLPGNLLSHYLWPHHYRQLIFVRNSLVADLRASADQRFADVGIGTGFYSRVLLEAVPSARGTGYDVSEFSLAYAREQVEAFGCGERYALHARDVMADVPAERVPFLVCVEVLEHLEDPPALLRSLRTMLAPGGKAFITAAINAPNADHIYLYRSGDEVLAQLVDAGFHLEQGFLAAGYRPRAAEPVPTIAAFLVT